ncbi:ferredoxin, partial [Streptomyces stelliscabiei]|uniref:ferredoxin n=1 Tax=Streptomyces stelliscabiei TaxID=146820 RepID=UPI000AE0FBB5
MRVELDEPKCVASGQCVMASPEVFDQRDDDGVAILLVEHPADDHRPPHRSTRRRAAAGQRATASRTPSMRSSAGCS